MRFNENYSHLYYLPSAARMQAGCRVGACMDRRRQADHWHLQSLNMMAQAFNPFFTIDTVKMPDMLA
jgi:hypothetical protein